MRTFFHLVILGCALLLSACAGPNGTSSNQPLSVQIENLERTERQMHKQYVELGETLTKLGTRISELRTRAAQQRRAAATLPVPTAQAAAAATPAPAPAEPAPEPAKPTELAASTPAPAPAPAAPPAVGGLTDQDISAQAAPAPTAPTASPSPEAPVLTPNGASYLVHVASYLDTSQVKPGWRELSTKHAEALRGLKPYVTLFVDGQRRHWLRLSGGVTSPAQAAKRCEQIKQAGDWCEVLRSPNAAMRELR